MEVSKKRSSDSVKSASPKKQKVSRKAPSGKGKQAKDSNKPKRPKTAYLHFMDDFRQRRKDDAKNGEEKSTKIGDVAKDGGAAWGKMSDKEKQPYIARYEKEKAEYDVKMKLLKPAKDENKPKRPMTSFLYFLEKFREDKKEEGITGPEVSKLAGIEWKAMSEEEKKVYVQRQQKAKAKYDEEMTAYNAKNPDEPAQKKSKKSKAKVQESESEEEEEEEEEADEDDDEEDEDEEDEESD